MFTFLYKEDYFMKKTALLLCFAILVTCFVGLVACRKNPQNEDDTPAKTDLFWRSPDYSQAVYVVKANAMSAQELEMVASLQGIVAQTSAAIYIDYDQDSSLWLSQCADLYGLQIVNIENCWKLVETFRSYIGDGKYVLYSSRHDENAAPMEQSINYATVVAAVDHYLMVSEDIEEQAKQSGLTLGRDVTEGCNTASIFAEYKDRLNKSVLVHQNPDKWQLRDYAIAARAMCFYSDYYDGSANAKEEIMQWADTNCPILGWTENEVNFVAANSVFGQISVAADWCKNLSFTSALPADDNYTQKNYAARDLKAEQGKHYLAIVMSDGDNLQWMQNGFASDSKYFGSQHRGEIPMTWTIAPSMYNLSPNVLKYLYEQGTASDQFIAGPSGIGYINPAQYNADAIDGYAKLTAAYMQATGLEYINTLDAQVDKTALEAFARYDSIKGGIMSEGDMYIEGNGSVYWCNGKPFVSVRETLWRTAGNDDDNNYYGFVERVAQRINNYSTDCTTIEGYTVLVAHAWSIGSMDYIARFAEQLDDHVELVTVGELLDLVSANVAHSDKTELEDIGPADITDLAPIGSEQYNVKTIESIPVDERHSFNFDDKSARNNYQWIFGNGGLQYDFAGYTSEGIKLDGSDLEDVVDPLPNSWAVNKFTLSPTDKYLTVFATHPAGCDVNFRVRILYAEDGHLVSHTLISADYEKQLNDYGWYRMDNASPMVYTYDVSAFAGKTVAVSVEQDDTGDGSGEVVFISKLIISDKVEDGSDLTYWTASDLAAYWKKQGEVTRHTEGICLEGKDAGISCKVTVTSGTLKITMRKFERPIFEGQDVTAYAIVRFGGNIIRVKGAVTDYIDVANTDEHYYYTYDISQFVGQTGTLEIICVEVNGVVGEHICISAVSF